MALTAILDTRFYFSYYNPESEAVLKWAKDFIRRVIRGEIRAASSVITIIELYRTMGRVIGKEAMSIRISSIKAANIGFIPITEEIAKIAGEIVLKNPKVPIADAIIAATAIKYSRGVVVTDDPHFNSIKGVKSLWLGKIG